MYLTKHDTPNNTSCNLRGDAQNMERLEYHSLYRFDSTKHCWFSPRTPISSCSHSESTAGSPLLRGF